MSLTKAKIADLRKRMVRHGVKGGKAVVELTARELQELLDAVDKPAPRYGSESVGVPGVGDGKHLYEVTVVLLDRATREPDNVVRRAAAACVDYGIPVVDGYGMKVKNLTLTDPRNKIVVKGMICTGFVNKPVPKKAEKVDVIVRR